MSNHVVIVLVVVLILLLVGFIPGASLGVWPSGAAGFIILVLLILLIAGKL